MPMSSPVQPDDDTAAGLKAKKDNIAEYEKAAGPLMPGSGKPAGTEKPATPAPAAKPSPATNYGSRPGEKRIDVSGMLKPLGSFKKGTPHVPKTGVYKLHEGEAVIPKDKNPMAADWTKGITGGKKPKKEIKRITHTKMHDGKIHTTHEHHHPEHHPDEHFAHDDTQALASHMEQHAGTPNDGEQAGGADAAAQLTASPSPMPEGTGAAPGATPGSAPAGM